jgi:APA family basic amino acid/polyamine antiporter
MIGSGVFLLPASLAPYGAISLLGWLVSAAGSVLLALVFAQLSRFSPATGGPYAYTRMAFGDFAGFWVAWGYWLSVCAANAALAVAFVGYLDPFVPAIVRAPLPAASVAVAVVWLLTAVNVRGVPAAGRVQLVTTALKIIPLLVIGVAGIVLFHPSHFSTTAASGGLAKNVVTTATLTLWAFLGMECATIPAHHTARAERTIPRATILGTLITAAIYILSTVGVMSLLEPAMLARSTAPFADAALALAGRSASELVALGAAISCFGALNGWVLIVGQIPLAVANDGLFPAVFGRLSRRGTPALAMIISASMSTALIAMNYSRSLVELFTFIILLATLSTLVPYLFCSLAVFVLRARDRRFPWTPTSALVASLAFVYSFFAVGGAGADVVFWGFLLLVAGLPVYVWVTSGER